MLALVVRTRSLGAVIEDLFFLNTQILVSLIVFFSLGLQGLVQAEVLAADLVDRAQVSLTLQDRVRFTDALGWRLSLQIYFDKVSDHR